MINLNGLVAFITGGSSGIGLGIARACIEAGMKVVVTYRTESHMNSALRKFFTSDERILPVVADVRSRSAIDDAVARAIDEFGAVNLICANAGIRSTASILNATPDDWSDTVATNILGVVNTVGAFIPHLLTSRVRPCHIVATSSMSGLLHGSNTGLYTTTKFAVVGMMEALRAELRTRNIGVSVLCPGFVQNRTFEPLQGSMATAMDPLECGRRVLTGVRRNDMYIVTHPEFKDGIRERFDALISAFEVNDEFVPEARIAAERRVLRHPIYSYRAFRQRNR